MSIEVKVEQHISIKLPAHEIFTHVSDLANMVDWSNIVIAARQLSPEPIHVGTTLRSTIRFLGKWLDITFEVVEYEPGRYVAFKSIAGGGPFFICFHLEAAEDGGTTIHEEALVHFIDGIHYLEVPVLTRAIQRQFEYDLLTLKDILENSVSLHDRV